MSIEGARLLVVAISDPISTRMIVSVARKENNDIYIIVRTRYLAEVDDLKKLGADEVIPEEFETSIEIFALVLHQFNFSHDVILDMIDKIRSNSYIPLRSVEFPRRQLFERNDLLPEIQIEWYKVSESSFLAEKSINELQVRKKTGVTIIAVRRGQEVFTNPEPDFRLKAEDTLLFTGKRKNMFTALNYFRGKM
jgi:CPA2 family monovalent cation:H+ antiporter-2